MWRAQSRALPTLHINGFNVFPNTFLPTPTFHRPIHSPVLIVLVSSLNALASTFHHHGPFSFYANTVSLCSVIIPKCGVPRIRPSPHWFYSETGYNTGEPKYPPPHKTKYEIPAVSVADPDPDPDADFLPIPDPGSRGQKGTGSRIPDPDPQHCPQ
jgi:hypothetical protein